MNRIAAILISLAVCSTAFAKWTKTKGPEGGFVSIIFNDPVSGSIFAGGNGFYQSTDNGATWSESNSGMDADASPIDMVRSGSDLYAASLSKVYRSTDNGNTWTGSTVPSQVISLGTIGGVIIAGTGVYGAYRSTDNGGSWQLGSGFDPANNIVQAIATVGTKLIAGLGGKAVWASNDSGKSWARSYTGTAFGAGHTVNAFALHNGKVFAACSDSAIFVSTGGGYAWTQSASGMNPRAQVSTVVSNGTDLYARVVSAYVGVDTGVVYRSTNNGASWSSVKSDLWYTNGNCIGFGTGKVFYGTAAGIYATTNNGAHWYSSNTGLTNASPYELAVNGTTLFAGTIGGIAKTDDGGATWIMANEGLPPGTGASSLTVRGGYIFAATGNGVVRSNDNGASWSPANNGLTGFALYTSKVASGATSVYVGGTFGGVYVSTDDGGNWTGPGTGLPGFGGIGAIFVDGSDLWVGAGSSGIYHSTDNGGSWTPASTGLPDFSKTVGTITRSGSTLYAGLSTYAGSPVYRSTDGGASWTGSSNGIPAVSFISTLTSVGSFVFAGFGSTNSGTGGPVYRTSDNGANWTPVSEGLPIPSSVNSYAVTGGSLFAAYLGVWKRPLSEVTGVRLTSQAIPERFALEQNYPNPFNPETKLRFEIRETGHARLAIYDALGREVATIVDQALRPGSYEIPWNASGCSSGIYYLRLTSGSYAATRKIVLAR